MTALVQTSVFKTRGYNNYNKKYLRSSNFYQATITDFDGEDHDIDEIEAETYEEAAAYVESWAASNYIQISYMQLYLIG